MGAVQGGPHDGCVGHDGCEGHDGLCRDTLRTLCAQVVCLCALWRLCEDVLLRACASALLRVVSGGSSSNCEHSSSSPVGDTLNII